MVLYCMYSSICVSQFKYKLSWTWGGQHAEEAAVHRPRGAGAEAFFLPPPRYRNHLSCSPHSSMTASKVLLDSACIQQCIHAGGGPDLVITEVGAG